MINFFVEYYLFKIFFLFFFRVILISYMVYI